MPVIKAVAYNFVTERCPGEVMALGINSIREVARRIPALLEEEGMDVLVVVSFCSCFFKFERRRSHMCMWRLWLVVLGALGCAECCFG